MYDTIQKYFKKHTLYNSFTHVIVGVGVGVLFTYPFAGVHPVRWGILFLTLGTLGHLYPALVGKK